MQCICHIERVVDKTTCNAYARLFQHCPTFDQMIPKLNYYTRPENDVIIFLSLIKLSKVWLSLHEKSINILHQIVTLWKYISITKIMSFTWNINIFCTNTAKLIILGTMLELHSFQDGGSKCTARFISIFLWSGACLYLAIMRCVIVYEDQSSFFVLIISIEYFIII
jgi:hypothetical protein